MARRLISIPNPLETRLGIPRALTHFRHIGG
jgi:hypothetical protein